MKKIYIVLMHTNTMPSKFIKLFTKYPYTHVGISLDEDCTTIYSFGRKKLQSIFPAGFIVESRNGAFFQKFCKTICRIYEIGVTEEQFLNLKKLLKDMEENHFLYQYDFLGLFLRYFHIPYVRDKKYVCSTFVADVLSKLDILKFSKQSCFVEPRDFEQFPSLHLLYEGKYLNFHNQDFQKNCYIGQVY